MEKTELLRQVFGYSGFRPGQEELIDGILSGRDVFGIMPTGGGKSMCYQLPGLMLPGITLVISPLISLMRDQVMALKAAGVPAAYINSTLNAAQMQAVYRNLLAGEGYLRTEQEHQTLRLTDEAPQVLYHGRKVTMLVRKEEIKAAPKAAKLSGSDAELYDALRELRAELAKESNVPAYVIFSNATLTDMAKKNPKTMSEFKRVSGIGEIKASWYGKPFLKRIKDFREETE